MDFEIEDNKYTYDGYPLSSLIQARRRIIYDKT